MKKIVPLLFILFACNKNREMVLPEYDSEIVVEMYLEDGQPLKCIVSESLAYSSSAINSHLNNAQVILSDGTNIDTIKPAIIYDYVSGRNYNYSDRKIFYADTTKTYTLKITDSLKREITASTTVPHGPVKIDKIIYTASSDNTGKFSVGCSFTDPVGTENFYRAIIGKGVDNYMASHTDLLFSDQAFNGKEHSFNSKPGYEKNDTVTVRLYSLLADHYNFLQLTEAARSANSGPFMQPVQVRSNIKGGQGIFTAIRYYETRIIIR